MEYDIYEWQIKPRGSFMTLLESDIVWGHIIWAARYIDGEEKLKELLNEFNSGNPPFIVSNGFYTGFFPFFNKKPINRSDTDSFSEVLGINGSEGILKTIQALKSIKKVKEVSVDLFEDIREGNSSKKLLEECFEGKRCPKCFKLLKEIGCSVSNGLNSTYKNNCKVFHVGVFPNENDKCIIEKKQEYSNPKTINETVMKNSINRLTGTTGEENSLFTQKEFYYDETKTISIYFKIRKDYDVKKLEEYLNYIIKDGFGKRKSTGKGFFESISFNKNDKIFKTVKNPNGYIVLSNYIPSESDFTEVIGAEIMTKRGKLSGEFSGDEKPFKKPIVLYQSGSLFKGENREYHGKMLQNVHFNKEIVHYGYSFSLGVNLDE